MKEPNEKKNACWVFEIIQIILRSRHGPSSYQNSNTIAYQIILSQPSFCRFIGGVATAQIPTINQETGIAGSEPTETLKGFRSDRILLPNRKPQGQVREQTLFAYALMLI